MKKALLLVSILFISVVSTACINKFAVQELNNKAKSYIEQGDYENAIERLKSSADLDGSVFETHYNLAVAYTQAEDYQNAINSFRKAIELNPEFSDAYYSLAVAEEDFSIDLAKGVLTIDENGAVVRVDEETLQKQDKITLSDTAKQMINDLLSDAVNNYNLYLEKGQNLQDGDEVRQKIQKLIEEQNKNQQNTEG